MEQSCLFKTFSRGLTILTSIVFSILYRSHPIQRPLIWLLLLVTRVLSIAICEYLDCQACLVYFFSGSLFKSSGLHFESKSTELILNVNLGSISVCQFLNISVSIPKRCSSVVVNY